jgi:hypothetical protein
VPAEYEPVAAVVLGWKDSSAAPFLTQIAKVVASGGAIMAFESSNFSIGNLQQCL